MPLTRVLTCRLQRTARRGCHRVTSSTHCRQDKLKVKEIFSTTLYFFFLSFFFFLFIFFLFMLNDNRNDLICFWVERQVKRHLFEKQVVVAEVCYARKLLNLLHGSTRQSNIFGCTLHSNRLIVVTFVFPAIRIFIRRVRVLFKLVQQLQFI